MNYQTIVDAIRDTANEVNPTGTFTHGRNSDQANTPEKAYPRINLFPFIQERTPGNLHERKSNLLMYFVKADSGENDMAEREATIAEMQTLVDSFITQLETDFENSMQFDRVRDEPLYNILEGVTGYGLSMDITTSVSC